MSFSCTFDSEQVIPELTGQGDVEGVVSLLHPWGVPASHLN
jgi:hypothetical protein